MRKSHSIRLMTAGFIITTALAATACSKSSSLAATLPMEAEEPVEDSGESLVNANNETETTKAAKDNKSSKDTDKTVSSSSAAKESSSVTTKASETTTTKPVVTESTTQASSSAQSEPTTEASTQNSTEPVTEAPTQNPTETTTEASTQKETEPVTEAPKHSHDYTSVVTLEPTCTSEGTRTFTCDCGDTYTESIPAIGHNFGAYTYNNDATEQADGTETAICSVCGERNTRTASGTKLAHTHSYSAKVTKAATCAEEGVTTFTCSCGDSYTEPIAKTEHSFGDYVYNNDATTDADGTQTRTCSVCGVTDTVTAEGTKKSLPSWYDEHSEPLNTTTGCQDDGSLEAYWISGQFDWNGAAMGCDAFGYSDATEIVGRFAEGAVVHGYLY